MYFLILALQIHNCPLSTIFHFRRCAAGHHAVRRAMAELPVFLIRILPRQNIAVCFSQKLRIFPQKDLPVVVIFIQTEETVVIMHAPGVSLKRYGDPVSFRQKLDTLEGIVKIPAV